MCLAVLSLSQNPRFPVVLAANRDEFFHRPAQPLDWWTPPGAETPVLAGRDLSAGGTWFGVSPNGRLALLTNVRDPARLRADAPSRGRIVTDWLCGDTDIEAARREWQRIGFNGFNVIAADLCEPHWAWTDGQAPAAVTLRDGLHGLSNASLDAPWPKVVRLRDAMTVLLQQHDHLPGMVEGLFAALLDPTRAADTDLPQTGVPLPMERALSSVFIRTDDGRYGTRCSTVLVGERDGDRLRLHVFERTYAGDGGVLAYTQLPRWPGSQVPTAILRTLQPGQGLATTLSSTLANVPAS